MSDFDDSKFKSFIKENSSSSSLKANPDEWQKIKRKINASEPQKTNSLQILFASTAAAVLVAFLWSIRTPTIQDEQIAYFLFENTVSDTLLDPESDDTDTTYLTLAE